MWNWKKNYFKKILKKTWLPRNIGYEIGMTPHKGKGEKNHRAQSPITQYWRIIL